VDVSILVHVSDRVRVREDRAYVAGAVHVSVLVDPAYVVMVLVVNSGTSEYFPRGVITLRVLAM
jgi:hypothetical protein